ncbi:MAG TPA: DinB family protein [Bacteroidota bacterium]|nr:DinB family protein [Bacteroidota bacterium]
MIRTIVDFDHVWSGELESTQKLFKHLTDRSLAQAVGPEGRTLARLAWHITTTIPEMMERTGLKLSGPKSDDPIPQSAREIARGYSDAAISLLEQVKAKWTDVTLLEKDEMYGETWQRGYTLFALTTHQIHHRAQMTVLMRQAGLEIPGLYGPARQEWAAYGMKPPEI